MDVLETIQKGIESYTINHGRPPEDIYISLYEWEQIKDILNYEFMINGIPLMLIPYYSDMGDSMKSKIEYDKFVCPKCFKKVEVMKGISNYIGCLKCHVETKKEDKNEYT